MGFNRIEVSLLAAAAHPLVGPIVQRRLAYVVEQFAAIGFDAREAAHRGMLAYTAYVGHVELAARVPTTLTANPPGYADSVIDLLLAGSA